MRLTWAIAVVVLLIGSCSQPDRAGWSESEKGFHATAEGLSEFLSEHEYDSTLRDTIISRYVYFDNILQDTSLSRLQGRRAWLDTLLVVFDDFVDSVGMANLDAKPLRFCADDTVFFEPYAHELREAVPVCLAYFDKRNPDQMIGTLLFEEQTQKLGAWVVLNQGEARFFLTFSLL